jgi:hypothetical protein
VTWPVVAVFAWTWCALAFVYGVTWALRDRVTRLEQLARASSAGSAEARKPNPVAETRGQEEA